MLGEVAVVADEIGEGLQFLQQRDYLLDPRERQQESLSSNALPHLPRVNIPSLDGRGCGSLPDLIEHWGKDL